MYTISRKGFHKILDKKAIAIVGEQCKRVEMIRDDKSIPLNTKCELIKNLIKEIVYESMRDLEVQVKSFSDGLTYFKVNMISPSAKKNG